MKFNIHAGHNPDGKIACGAVGLLNESTEARKVKDKVIENLEGMKHTAYDCTVDDGKNQNDVLKKIVKKCNKHTVDIDVSIHLDAGRKDKKGDGNTGGVTVYVYSETSKAFGPAVKVAKKISKALGITNRGVKVNPGYYVLNNTNSPAMLIECCFVDDKDDAEKWDSNKCGLAIAEGLLNTNIKKTSMYYKQYTGPSTQIDVVLKAIGVNSKYYGSYSKRKAVAKANGISGYIGSWNQNTKLVNLAKQGKLKKV